MHAQVHDLIEHLPALVAIGFLAYGLGYLISVDSLFGVTRLRLERWAYRFAGDEPVAYKPTKRWPTVGGLLRGKLVDLIGCPRCSSFWCGFFAWWALGTAPWTLAFWIEVFVIRGVSLFLLTRPDRFEDA